MDGRKGLRNRSQSKRNLSSAATSATSAAPTISSPTTAAAPPAAWGTAARGKSSNESKKQHFKVLDVFHRGAPESEFDSSLHRCVDGAVY
jgi:hypothetical protein